MRVVRASLSFPIDGARVDFTGVRKARRRVATGWTRTGAGAMRDVGFWYYDACAYLSVTGVRLLFNKYRASYSFFPANVLHMFLTALDSFST